MNNPNPDLVVLPFRATIAGTSDPLTFEQVIALLNKGLGKHIQVERSYPGAPQAIGWTVFHRTSHAYCYEAEPLFRSERGARKHIRKAYAVQYSINTDDLMTYSHLHL